MLTHLSYAVGYKIKIAYANCTNKMPSARKGCRTIAGVIYKRTSQCHIMDAPSVHDGGEDEEKESPKTRRKRIKDNDTVENDRHKDDFYPKKRVSKKN